MTAISQIHSETIDLQSVKPTPGITTHNHTTKPDGTYEGDNFVCSNKKDIKKWLACAKKDGKCDGLSYKPEKTTTFLFFFKFTTQATYTYKAKPGDTAQKVREMFNLKPGALRKHDEYIFDIHEPYQVGKEITFDEDDIMP